MITISAIKTELFFYSFLNNYVLLFKDLLVYFIFSEPIITIETYNKNSKENQNSNYNNDVDNLNMVEEPDIDNDSKKKEKYLKKQIESILIELRKNKITTFDFFYSKYPLILKKTNVVLFYYPSFPGYIRLRYWNCPFYWYFKLFSKLLLPVLGYSNSDISKLIKFYEEHFDNSFYKKSSDQFLIPIINKPINVCCDIGKEKCYIAKIILHLNTSGFIFGILVTF